MNVSRKFWFVLIGGILTLGLIACSCSSLTSILSSPTPTPTTPVNPMPELEGYWWDSDTNNVHVIEWQNGQYVVTAVNDDEYGSFAVTSQSWDGNTLTWTYQVSYNDVLVTFETISVSGDNLYTNWSNSDGDSGTWTLERVSSSVPPVSTEQEPMPGLAGYWLDTDTNDVHVIEWQNGEYVVTAVNDDEYGYFDITSQFWDGTTLTWTYQVSYNDVLVTFETISVSGDSLYTNWSNSEGDSGTWTLERVSSPIPSALASSGGEEAIPGLAGDWLDPDTTGTVTTIVWENGEYVITQIMNPDRGVNELTWYTWENGTLNWEYCPEGMNCITSQLVDVYGDSMTAEWWWSDGGNGGTTTYQRLP